MSSPHAHTTTLLKTKLDGWNIVHGDRFLDAAPKKRTALLYTSSIEPLGRASGGGFKAELTMCVFGRNVPADQIETELWDALTHAVGVINSEESIGWSNARRAIINDLPAYQLTITLGGYIEQTNNEQ